MKIPLYLLTLVVHTAVARRLPFSGTTTSTAGVSFQPQPQVLSNRQISALLLRGGDRYASDEEYDEDEYDEDDDDDIDNAQEDEATAMHQNRRNQQRQAPKRPVVDSRGHSKAPYLPRKKKKPNPLSQLASTSINLSKKAALTTVQTSGKAAFYLMRPKSIQRKELWGLWRLDQQVGLQQSTATVEFTPKGLVIVRDDTGIIWKAAYTFRQPTWPQSCRVEFEAKAFQPSGKKKKKPWLLFYRGYLERKVADPKVIKMVGKLYDIDRPKSMFGKELPPKYTKIGTFVGRKRVMIQDDDDEDEYDDEEDEEEEEEGPRYQRSRRPRPEEEDEEDEYDDYDDEL